MSEQTVESVLKQTHSLELMELVTSSWEITLPVLILCILSFAFRKPLSNFLHRHTVRFNLTLLVSSFLLLTICIGSISEYYMARLGSQLREIAEEDLPLTAMIASVEVSQMHQSIWFERAIIRSLKGQKEALLEAEEKSLSYGNDVKTKISQAIELAGRGEEFATSDESLAEYARVAEILTEIAVTYGEYDARIKELFIALADGSKVKDSVISDLESLDDTLNDKLIKLLFEVEQFTINSSIKAEHYEQKAEFKILVLLILGLITATSIATVIYKVLTIALSKTSGELHQVTSEMNDVTSGLSTASSELKEASELSQQTLMDTSGAMSEIASGNRNNFEMLRLMKQSTDVVEDVVKKAAISVTDLVDSIKEIESANKELKLIKAIIRKIDDQTDVINSIVFKTQLLSVNASIEASQAGVHGKGFSVVAEEVSKLANMSGKSAEAIDELLQQSNQQVEDILAGIQTRIDRGAKNAQHVVEVFETIGEELAKMTNQNNQVFVSAEEQNIGIEKINRALFELRQVTDAGVVVANNVNVFSNDLLKHNNDLGMTTEKIVSLVRQDRGNKVA